MFPKGSITKNPQLQQDIERYMRLSDGASRILSISQNPLQCLNAAKMLFVSNAQLLSCLRQVQQEKVRDASSTDSTDPDFPHHTSTAKLEDNVAGNGHHISSGRAKICLSDIRIPLLWRDTPLGTGMQLLMNRLFPSTSILSTGILAGSGDSTDKSDSGDQCEGYSVFCLAQVGNVIKDTQLIFDIKPGTTDIEFDDKLIFDDVTADFRCTIEVYAYPRSPSKGSSAFARRRTLLLDNLRKSSDHPESGPISGAISQNSSNFFELVGHCVATLADVGSRVRARTLELGPQLPCTYTNEGTGTNASPKVEDSNGFPDPPTLYSLEPGSTNSSGSDLPLFGSICYRLVAQPNSVLRPLISGLLWIRQLTTSPAQVPALLHYCELGAGQLWTRLILHTPTAADQAQRNPQQTDMQSSNADSGTFSLNSASVGTRSVVRRRIRHRKSRSDSEGRLTLAITPKTLFLDKEPVLRVLNIRFPTVSHCHAPSEKALSPCTKVTKTDTKQSSSEISSSVYDSRCGTQLTELEGVPSSSYQSIFRKKYSSLSHWRSASNLRGVNESATSAEPHAPSRWRSSAAIFATASTNRKVIDMLDPSVRTEQLDGETLENCGSCPDFSQGRCMEHFTRHRTRSAGRSPSPNISDFVDCFINRSPGKHSQPRTHHNRFRHSRSLGSLVSCPNSGDGTHNRTSLPSVWYGPPQRSSIDSVAKSALSEPFVFLPLDDLDQPSMDRAVEVGLYTFRIATSSTTTQFTGTEVYEFAVPKHDIRTLTSSDSFVNSGQSLPDNPLSELQLATRWIDILQQHVLEQKTWGADAFSDKIVIPRSTSTVHNAVARRSIAFPTEQPVSSLNKLFTSPPLPTCVEIN
ncbi:unnamed protein product [Dicrocoelium dendriticum]|nr:unnamed protein product [Dicrocoelium dendriticum]